MAARLARHRDIPAIVDLAKEAHGRSAYKHVGFDDQAATRAVQRHIGMGLPPSIGSAAIFVAGEDGISAALAAICAPLYECLGALLITDVFWYAGGGRGGVEVLDAFHDWASLCKSPYVVRQGVTDFISDSPDRAATLLTRRGLRKAGYIFEKENLT